MKWSSHSRYTLTFQPHFQRAMLRLTFLFTSPNITLNSFRRVVSWKALGHLATRLWGVHLSTLSKLLLYCTPFNYEFFFFCYGTPFRYCWILKSWHHYKNCMYSLHHHHHCFYDIKAIIPITTTYTQPQPPHSSVTYTEISATPG